MSNGKPETTTSTLEISSITKIGDYYHWDVAFSDGGLNQSGKCASVWAALECITGAIENAVTDQLVAHLTPGESAYD